MIENNTDLSSAPNAINRLDSNEIRNRLLSVSLPYWRGEFFIASQYFSLKRTLQKDEFWLAFQVRKEWEGSGVYGPKGIALPELIEKCSKLLLSNKNQLDFNKLSDACEMLQFAKDELNHYLILLRVYNQMFGEFPPNKYYYDLKDYLPEIRYKIREEDPSLGEIAVRLSEGGGLGMYYGINSVLSKTEKITEIDKNLLIANEVIIEEEITHISDNFDFASQQHLDENLLNKLEQQLKKILHAKLNERNIQFGLIIDDLDVSIVSFSNTSDYDNVAKKLLQRIFA
jgi:hypothetical protein